MWLTGSGRNSGLRCLCSVGRPRRCSMHSRSGSGRSGLFRFMLGLAEPGNWPAAAKAVAEWFPARQRALGIGIFNAGSSIGSAICAVHGRAYHVWVWLADGVYRHRGAWTHLAGDLVGSLRSSGPEPVATT